MAEDERRTDDRILWERVDSLREQISSILLQNAKQDGRMQSLSERIDRVSDDLSKLELTNEKRHLEILESIKDSKNSQSKETAALKQNLTGVNKSQQQVRGAMLFLSGTLAAGATLAGILQYFGISPI